MSLAHRIGVTAWIALILLQAAWYAWLFPPQRAPLGLVLTLTVAPLLLPCLAMGNVRRALLWAGMLSLFYFCHGLAESWSSAEERLPALLEVLLTLVLIGALGAGIKRRASSPEATLSVTTH